MDTIRIIAGASIAIAAASLAACGGGTLGTSSVEDCVAQYASRAPSQASVNMAVGMCRQLHEPQNYDEEQRQTARCVLAKLADTPTEQGVRALLYACEA